MQKKEVEISLDFSTILAKLNKIHLALLALIVIFYLSFSVRLETVNEPYLLAADPHYWYRMTKFVIEGAPEYDTLRLWPEPPKFNPGLYPYLAAYSYKIVNLITGVEFYRFLFWFPAFVTALSIFPAFWIGRELHSNKAGLFSAFFIGLTPSILSRTMGGFFDTDCTNIFFSLLVIALFLSAYNRVNNIKKALALSFLSGLSLASFALIWSGYSYISWLFIGLLVFHWIYQIIVASGRNLIEKFKNSWLFFKAHFLVYIIIFITFILVTFPFIGFNSIKQIIGTTTFFQTAKAEGGIFPNVWVSISEEMHASTWEIMARVGVPIFCFGLLGIFFLFILSLTNLKKKPIYPETFIFMALWILPTLYGSFWAIRFTMLLALPLSISAGIALGILFDFCIKQIKYGREK